MYRHDRDIAVIGFAGRFAGAHCVEAFEHLIREGHSSFRRFTPEELAEDGVAEATLRHPDYVPISGYVDRTDEFDATFFGFSSVEAQLMDPQHRLFLETAHEALERAGCSARISRMNCGVFASCGMALYSGKNSNTYFRNNVEPHDALLDSVDAIQVKILNDKDYLPTQLSYRLNLKGPSVLVQTACSSALVAVQLAVENLRAGSCDVALTGAAALHAPRKAGYLRVDGGIYSTDGRCAPFSDLASGTVGGNGVGVLLLRRLGDALRDGDTIHAVIRGAAVNNDGMRKVSFTAPSLEGQRTNIIAALRDANVSARQIGYVEAHGTGTRIGDPIEVAALSQAFSLQTADRQFCALGSVKANVGHLDTAAGIAGLLKVILLLKRREIPPQPHFESPNPLIDFPDTPFFVNRSSRAWDSEWPDRTALVGSLGAGGTNAHVVVSEWNAERADDAPRDNAKTYSRMLTISAKSEQALRAYVATYETFLQSSEATIEDVCGSALTDREHFNHRLAAVADNAPQMVERLRAHLRGEQTHLIYTGELHRPPREGVTFAFSGQGTQRRGMGRALYEHFPLFRSELDCLDVIYRRARGHSLLDLMFEDRPGLQPTQNAQPAIFAFGWALASQWIGLGVKPAAMLGHSVGEFVAASLAGVMSRDDAFELVMKRGELIGSLEVKGGMLAVMASRARVESAMRELDVNLSIAAENAPDSVVVSGLEQHLERFSAGCAAALITCKRLHVSHAFHSALMDPILESMREAVAGVALTQPSIKLVSNVTGELAGSEIATADYWVRHLRGEVRFHESLKYLAARRYRHFLEIGAKPALAAHIDAAHPETIALVSNESQNDVESLRQACAQLYVLGQPVDWSQLASSETFSRVALPTYPFQRQSYWLPAVPARANDHSAKEPSISPCRLFTASWSVVPAPAPADPSDETWIVIGPGAEARSLVDKFPDVRTTLIAHALEPGTSADAPLRIARAVREACAERPCRVVFAPTASASIDESTCELVGLLQLAHSQSSVRSLHLITHRAQPATAQCSVNPTHAALWSLLRSARLENRDKPITASDLDDDSPDAFRNLLNQIAARKPAMELAFRQDTVFEPRLVAAQASGSANGIDSFAPSEPVVMTGGFGDIALYLTERLVARGARKIVLVGRTPPAESVAKRLAAWNSNSKRVVPVVCDIADASALEQALHATFEPAERIGIVLHLAGTLADATVPALTHTHLARVLRPKAKGFDALMAATAAFKPRRAVLFSSLAATFGSAGQAHYAAANGYLDGAAHSSCGDCKVTSIGWGPWADIGMATRGVAVRHLDAVQGKPLSSDQAYELLEAVLAGDCAHVLAVELAADQQALVAKRAALHEIADHFWSVNTSAQPAVESFSDRLKKASPPSRAAFAADEVCKVVAQLLGVSDVASIDKVGLFNEIGLDSLRIIQLRNRLNAVLGTRLLTSDFYNHATVERLAELIVERLVGTAPKGPATDAVEDVLDLISAELAAAGAAS